MLLVVATSERLPKLTLVCHDTYYRCWQLPAAEKTSTPHNCDIAIRFAMLRPIFTGALCLASLCIHVSTSKDLDLDTISMLKLTELSR